MNVSTLLTPNNLISHGKTRFTGTRNDIVPIAYIIKFIQQLMTDERPERHLPFMFLLAPTGAGKTIDFPLALMSSLPASGVPIHIAVTEPRIITCESAANTVAKLLTQPLGNQIGYSTGDGKIMPSHATASITFMTHTSLFPQFMAMNTTELKYNIFIIDEIHEMDQVEVMVLYLILKDFIKINYNLPRGRRLVIFQTATADALRFCNWLCSDMPSNYLAESHIIEVAGKPITIEEVCLKQPIGNSSRAITTVMTEMVVGKSLNLLVFMSDMMMANNLKEVLMRMYPKYKVILLNRAQLHKIPNLVDLINHGHKPYVILSTPVAQTGITFADLDFVIDDNLLSQNVYIPETRTEYFVNLNITTDIKMQRRGRVGRTKPGQYMPLKRLFGTDVTDIFPPAITYTRNLAAVLDWIVYINAVGIDCNTELVNDMFVPWPRNILNECIIELLEFGAIDTCLRPTVFGARLHMIKANVRIDLRSLALTILTCAYPNIDPIDVIFVLKISQNVILFNKLFMPKNRELLNILYKEVLGEDRDITKVNNTIADACILRRYIEKQIEADKKLDTLIQKFYTILADSYIFHTSLIHMNVMMGNPLPASYETLDELLNYTNRIVEMFLVFMPNNTLMWVGRLNAFVQHYNTSYGGHIISLRDLRYHSLVNVTKDHRVFYLSIQVSKGEIEREGGIEVANRRTIVFPTIY